jgi:DtxR family Mn-dependent transcriptional regulator
MNNNSDSEFRTSRGYQKISQQEGGVSSAVEDYLEMICRLCGREGYARVGKLSEMLNVKPSSASKMLGKLAEMGYIKYDRYEIILLTEEGQKVGTYLLKRHRILEEFLTRIGSPNPLEETELIEHSLSIQTVNRLNALLAFFRSDEQAFRKFQLLWETNDGKTEP